ncbi:hypothetical protein JMJ35_004888 [Cladonia borealis]|uniref:DUF6594 domain-containing protein n=1 Tax=Cladonia borealis TaxID=184061 RepID=A0AA39R3P8_9LECA|nr:hypothetical protein JMJ35_004888 [Cladonia borealis]
MAESVPQPPEHDIEAAPQQHVPDENAPVDGDKSSHSDQSPKLTYEQRLFEHVRPIRNTTFARSFIDFHDLSQINILRLMNELAAYDQAMDLIKAAPQDIEAVGDLLHRYTTAVQDFEYWSRLPRYDYSLGMILYEVLQRHFPGIYRSRTDVMVAHLGEVPKSASGSVDPLRRLLKRVLPRHLTWTEEELKLHFIEHTMDMTPEVVSSFVDTLARFIVAITGGLSLVVPMLVMRLDEHLKKSLITVSVAVLLFSALTSLMFKASNVETLAATAAYAAVLVVFVGTSS